MTSLNLEQTTARVAFWVGGQLADCLARSRSRARADGRRATPRLQRSRRRHQWRSGAPAVVWSMMYLAALGFAPLRLLTDLAVLPMTLRRRSYNVWTSRSAVSRPDSVIFFATSDVPSTSCGNAVSTVTTNRPAASIAAR